MQGLDKTPGGIASRSADLHVHGQVHMHGSLSLPGLQWGRVPSLSPASPACCPHGFPPPELFATVPARGSFPDPTPQGLAERGLRVTGPCGQGGLPEGGFSVISSFWPTACEQEAGAAGHSTRPMALGLLTAGKGTGGSRPTASAAPRRGLCLSGGQGGLWAQPLGEPKEGGLGLTFSSPLPPEVWAAWRGFVLERRRKKVRLERAVQAYHQQLLQEGVTCLLRFAAGMKMLRQQLHTQQQVQVGPGSPALLVGSGQAMAGSDRGCCRRPTASTGQSIAVPCYGNRRCWAQAGCLSPPHPTCPAGG